MPMKLLLGRSQRSATARTCRAASFGSRTKKEYQARASWKPIGAIKAKQRHIACFRTIPEAAQAVRDTEALLAAGGIHGPIDLCASANTSAESCVYCATCIHTP